MPYILLLVEKEKSLTEWYPTDPLAHVHKIPKRYQMAQFWIGGDDGNRTRVRKPIHTTFYERSLLFTFPRITANRHALMLSSLQYIIQTQALLYDVHHWSAPVPRPWYFSDRRAAIKQLLIQNYRCRLILKRVRVIEISTVLCSLIVLQSPRRNLYIPIGLKQNYLFFSLIALSISRFAASAAIASRLSWSFLPLQTPTWTFTLEPLK